MWITHLEPTEHHCLENNKNLNTMKRTRNIVKLMNGSYKLTCRSLYNKLDKKSEVKFLDKTKILTFKDKLFSK